MTTPARELEAQIFQHPDDPGPYLVYADWLQQAGDPRGKLIAAHAARAADPGSTELAAAEAAILDEHRDTLAGPSFDVQPAPAVEWFLGFWRTLRLGGFGWTPRPIGLDQIEVLLAHPSARFLRTLQLDAPVSQEVLVLVADKHRTLETLSVTLRNHPIDDGGLRVAASCTRLKRLALFSCQQITADGMSALRALGELQAIDLRNSSLSDAGAAHLAGLPLTAVRFNGVSGLTATGMRTIAELPLISLQLQAEQLDDGCVARLAGHPTLENLELGGAKIGARGAAALGSLACLQRLYVPDSTLGDAGVHELRGLTGLRSLNLSECGAVGDASCEVIARLTGMRFLSIGRTQVTGAGLRMLRPLRELTQLDLEFLELDDDALRVLAGFPALTQLSLRNVQGLTDASIDTLVRLDALEALELGSVPISERGIERLAALPRLRELGLEGCEAEVSERARSFDHLYVNTRDSVECWDSWPDPGP